MGDNAEKNGIEPIAIIGMGCRVPGNSSSPSQLWDMLLSERSGQSDIPANRFNIDAWYHPQKGRPGSIYSRGGYFLSHDDSYRNFDPGFFGIGEKEAKSMDAQHRKMLEVVYECLESAGVTLEGFGGTETSVYVGSFSTDFEHIMHKDPEYGVPYQQTGSALTILSNRINYVFNLKGPSFTIDTACSSSLYALHLACQSLLAGDCTGAIVGGASIITSVEKQMGSGRLGILSPTSTCHTFDASADGIGRGDGIAAIYIRKLSDAIADGDPIRAVIRATAINSNGAGPGISHPGREGQEAVIRKAYSRAGLGFDQTGYFECHGTGTPVGDPVECAAIGNVFAAGRTAETPLLIGSVKTNLGHTEGASGLAAVIKAVLCLEKGCIPATIGVKRLNPNIDFKDGRLKVVQTLTPWPRELANYRRASCNGFGFGGANAHVILDAADSFLPTLRQASYSMSCDAPRQTHTKQRYLLTFSAHDQATLTRNIKALQTVAPKYELRDMAYTLNKHRNLLKYRAFSICDATSSLANIDGSEMTMGVAKNTAPSLGFVFTGQGAQWPQMCYTLIQHYPLVRRTFEELDESLRLLSPPPDFSIIEVLSAPKESSTIYHSIRSPVCCTAIQIALIVLLESWGVGPTAVIGHSAGEIAAAFAAAHITAGEAVAIAYYRGLAVMDCKIDGAMLAVGLGAENVRKYIEGLPDVVVGCDNSPQSVTLSGARKAIEEVRNKLVEAGFFARMVNSSGNAYHSPLMKSAAKQFQNLFEAVYTKMVQSPSRKFRGPRLPMYSSITGRFFEQEIIPFAHWQGNLQLPVLFSEASQLMLKSHPTINCLIELGPHKALAGPVRQIAASLGFDEERLTYLPTLIRGQDGVNDILRLAGNLFCLGHPLDIVRVNSSENMSRKKPETCTSENGKLLVDLPGYQWNYEKLLWKESRWDREQRFRKHCRHDILGSLEPGGSRNSWLWRNHLELNLVPWLRDHKIGGNYIFPAAGYISLAIEALHQLTEDQGLLVPLQGYKVEELTIDSALIVPAEGSVELLFNVGLLADFDQERHPRFEFCLSSVTEDGKWSEHGKGIMSVVEPIDDFNSPQARTNPGTKSQHAQKWYTALFKVGVEFGPTFQTLSEISFPAKNEATSTLELCTTKDTITAESSYIIHPTSLDGCLQLSVMAAYGDTKSTSKAFLPVAIEEFTVWKRFTSDDMPEKAVIHARGRVHGLRSVKGSAEVFDDDGNLFVKGKVSFISLEGGLIDSSSKTSRKPYSSLCWKPDVDRLGALCDEKLNICSAPRIENLDLMGYLELLAHKARIVRILQIGCDSTPRLIEALHGGSKQQVFSQYTVASHDSSSLESTKKSLHGMRDVEFRLLDFEQSLQDQKFEMGTYDLIVLSENQNSTSISIQALKIYRKLLKPRGTLVIDISGCGLIPRAKLSEELTARGFICDAGMSVQSQKSIIIAQIKPEPNGIPHVHEALFLIYLRQPHLLLQEIVQLASACGIPTQCISLSDVAQSIPKDSRTIMGAELEEHLLTDIGSNELTALQLLIKNVSSTIWLINSGRLSGSDPRKALASGIAKTLMNEQPSLQMSCFDIESEEMDLVRSAALIVDQHLQMCFSEPSEVEMDLVEKNGIVYISRFLPDKVRNDEFDRKFNPPVELGLFSASPTLELDFQRVGQVESFYFKRNENEDRSRLLQPGEMLLDPEMYSLSALEAAILKGQQKSELFSHEFIAIVRAVGPDVLDFQPGDCVLSLSPGKFDSSIIVKKGSCYRLLPEESFGDICGTIVPLCTAIYALKTLSRVKRGQTVLIDVPCDHLLAWALVQVACQQEFQIYVTYTSGQETDHFHHVLKIPENCLIALIDTSWTKGLNALPPFTAIITSVPSQNHRDLARCLKRNGQYLFLGGGSSIPSLGSLSKAIFSKGASFTTFDIMNMIHEGGEELQEIIQEAFHFYRQTNVVPPSGPLVFDISQLDEAIALASSKENLDMVLLQCKKDSQVPVRSTPTPFLYNSSATYLMIGCLGGLGRTLTNQMVHRGARHFIFLSRSGAAKPEAATVLKQLKEYPQKHNIEVTLQVFRGDVSIRGDVDRAIAAAHHPIRGVIQAAAVFQECLFENMTSSKFHAVLSPKVRGTINLHEALINEPLDFFVMTSSAIGVKAPVTQSHYIAANAFLDSMARHRWSLGMQATSLALGMVQGIGHIEEHPEIESAMMHNGVQGIDQAEFLIMMEEACRPHDLNKFATQSRFDDTYAQAHIVTGLEHFNKASAIKNSWLQDARLRYLALVSKTIPVVSQNTDTSQLLADAFASGGQAGVKDAVEDIILKLLSKLVLVPAEKLKEDLKRPLAGLGMDSMVSSEIRSLAWKEFRVDVPLLGLLEKSMLVGELMEMIWERMDPGLKGVSA